MDRSEGRGAELELGELGAADEDEPGDPGAWHQDPFQVRAPPEVKNPKEREVGDNLPQGGVGDADLVEI